jgi:glycosyltransferase involved in cell wall biosynthesis
MVIRNTPPFQEFPLRPTGEVIEVLYHGIVSPGRGLEEVIQSVALWKPEFRLTIRGPVGDAYRSELQSRMAAAGVSDRVRLSPPVPMTDLVREAHAADVGLFVLPGHSRHNRYALPNKFFEYIMAGLALCVSDLPEMARLTGQYDLGRLVNGLSPRDIATQINSLDRQTIDCYKRNALAAARQLNWRVESGRLLDRCAALVTRFP